MATAHKPTDEYTQYEAGLDELLDQLGKEHPHYSDALIFEQQLRENILAVRRYGDTGDSRVERSKIIGRLNTLAVTTLGTSFNDLCRIAATARGWLPHSRTLTNHLVISYDRAGDREAAERIYERLKDAGIPVWLDVRDAGDDRERAFDEALHACRALLFVATHDSTTSEACREEWMYALRLKKSVVPFLIEAVALPSPLQRRQPVDAADSLGAGIRRLQDHLAWMESSAGELQELRNRLADLQYDLHQSSRPAAVQREIEALQAQIRQKAQALQTPDETRAASRRVTERGVDADRERFARAREQDRSGRRRRVVGSPPQGIAESFKDRARETQIINTLLSEHNDIRVVSIYGRGGIGKTALACAVMAALESDPEHIDGLAYLSTQIGLGIDLEQIFLTSARLLGGQLEDRLTEVWRDPQQDIAAKTQALLEAYGTNRYVLLLDRLEDLLDPNGVVLDPDLRYFIDAFLRQRHGGRLLVTSREPLNPANDVRRHERSEPLKQGLPIDEAVELLQEFDADGTLGLRDADPEVLQAVVERTHGYPRALEAIAGILAQDPFLSLRDLLDDTELFETEVIATLVHEAQSRLGADERRVMQALSVYGRPVSEAAVRFLLTDYVQGLDTRTILARLARGRFVTVKRTTDEIALNSMDRLYNYRQIPDGDRNGYTRPALEYRAADYYTQLRLPAEDCNSLSDLEPQLLEFEHRIKARAHDEAAALFLSEIADRLLLWGHERRSIRMGRQLVGKLADCSLEAKLYGALGAAHHGLGDYTQAGDFYRRALDVARDVGDRQTQGAQHANLGRINRHLNQYEQAIEEYHAALEIAESSGDERLMGTVLSGLGVAHTDLGRYDAAIEYFERAIPIAEALNHRRGLILRLSNLARAHSYLGQYDQALTYYEEALDAARRYRARSIEAYCLGLLGRAHLLAGRYDLALETLKRAEELNADSDKTSGQQYRATMQATAHLHRGEGEAALGVIEPALALDVPWNNFRVYTLYAVILARLNRPTETVRGTFDQALVLTDEVLAKTPQDPEAQYMRGLALAGLGLFSSDDTFLSRAQEAYRAAYATTSAPGLVAGMRALLDELAPVDPDERLASVRAVLTDAD